MTALHRYDITAAQWLTPREPAFIARSDQSCDVTCKGLDYIAYFQMDGWDAEIAILLGIYDYQTEAYLDADQAADAFGVPQIKLWEGECPEWGDADDGAQRGYDAARERKWGCE